MKTKFTTPRFYSSTALTLASLASAFALTASARASQLDPADPYNYTAGQYPTAQQNYGLPPQYTGQESMGMRQARMASGNVDQERVMVMSSGSQVTVETIPTTNAQGAAVSSDVAMDEHNLSPIQRAIHQSLRTIAQNNGAAAAADSNDIAPTLTTAPYETHQMLAVYQARVRASSNAIESTQARSAQFAGDTQANFNSAMQDVSSSRAQLDQDFAAAQTATPDNWSQVRSSLAVDYKRYSDAVAKAEAIGNGSRSS